MKRLRLLGLVIITAAFFNCKTTKPARPMERYDPVNATTSFSTIRIPIRIFRNELQTDLNKRLQGVIYEDNDIKDDGLMVKATKAANIELKMEGQTVSYKVPLDLWIKKDLAVADVEATGRLALDFRTAFLIKSDWALETTTEVLGFQWQKKPVLKLGFADLPIEFIANTVLHRSKGTISAAIDKQIKSSFNLREALEEVWKQMRSPILASEAYGAWMVFQPENLSITPFRNNAEVIESQVVVIAAPQIVLGEKPASMALKSLPPFTTTDFGTGDFSISINLMVPFKEAEKIARQNLAGQTFSSGKNSVKVEDIQLYGQGNRLVVDTKLSGKFNGSVYLLGEPRFNSAKNRVEIDGLDFEVNTKNFLYKSAAWLFKGTMKNKIRENLDFYLEYNLAELKKTIQNEMDSMTLAAGIKLNGQLTDIGIVNAVLTAEGIRVTSILKGHLGLEVRGW